MGASKCPFVKRKNHLEMSVHRKPVCALGPYHSKGPSVHPAFLCVRHSNECTNEHKWQGTEEMQYQALMFTVALKQVCRVCRCSTALWQGFVMRRINRYSVFHWVPKGLSSWSFHIDDNYEGRKEGEKKAAREEDGCTSRGHSTRCKTLPQRATWNQMHYEISCCCTTELQMQQFGHSRR